MPTDSRDVLRVRATATAGALCVVLSALAAAQAGDVGVESIRADALKGHVYFLSAPEMGGRDSLSLEGRIAANYIAGFFYRLGLKTVGDGGSYFQTFPMSESAIDRAQTRLRATVTAKSGATTRDRAARTSTSPHRSCSPATASTRRNTATTTTPVST